jgi:hypothetical protein
MRRLSIAVVIVVVACAILPLRSSGQPLRHQAAKGPVDWIFVVDTSQSMRGIGGTPDIFDRVKDSLDTFIGEAREDDSVTLYSFDRNVRFWGHTRIGGQFDREELHRLVRELRADGHRTHLGLAIRTALDRAKQLLSRGDETRQRSIVLFTDGREDTRGIENPVSIPSNIPLVAEVRPWIFFVSLGEHEPALDDLARHPSVDNRVTVIKPAPEEIRAAADRIRAEIETRRPLPQPPPEPLPAKISVQPAVISLGSVDAGGILETPRLTIRSDRNVKVIITLPDSGSGIALRRASELDVSPTSPAVTHVALGIPADAVAGKKNITLYVNAGRSETTRVVSVPIRIDFEIVHPSIWVRAAKWLAYLLALMIVLVALICLRRGDTPLGVWRQIMSGKQLEGELEIIHPTVSSETGFVGLPQLGRVEAALSEIVPSGTLEPDADARLFVRRRSGEKKMYVARNAGELRVNDVEVGEIELFDDDLISVAGAKIRFRWSGHNRPEDAT